MIVDQLIWSWKAGVRAEPGQLVEVANKSDLLDQTWLGNGLSVGGSALEVHT